MQVDVVRALKRHPVRFARLVGFDRLGEVHDEWIRKMAFGRGDWVLQAFRGSYKTTCVSVALALVMMLAPNDRVAFMRKTDTDVKEVLAQVRRMLETDEARAASAMVWGRPIRVVTATQSEITTSLTRDPRGAAQLMGMGINGSLTGKHFDRIFVDDIVNLKDRTSRAEREHTKQIWMELQNVVNRGGRIVSTGTPWHVDDAFTLMGEPEKWDYRSMPDVMSAEDAEDMRSRMSPSLFAANYELRHIPSDDVMFTNPRTGADPERVRNGECHVDAAYYGEDYTAFTALAVHDGVYYVYGRLWREHIDDVMGEIVLEVERLGLGRIHTERNADKGYGAKALRERNLRVRAYDESTNKHIKISTYLKSAWPDIVFVDGTDQAYIDQICDYTEDAEHDDAPDSLASLIRAYRPPSGHISVFG